MLVKLVSLVTLGILALCHLAEMRRARKRVVMTYGATLFLLVNWRSL
jgi:hypothetical protein